MTSLMIYLWTRLDVILGASIVGIIASCFLTGACVVGYMAEAESYKPDEAKTNRFKNLIKTFIKIGFISLFLAIFVPSKKDAAMIYIIPKMAQSETFNAISKETPEITKLALEVLKETLQDMAKENKQWQNLAD